MAEYLPARVDGVEHVLMRQRVIGAGDEDRPAFDIDILAPAADHAVVGVLGKEGDLPLESLGLGNVVIVHPGDQRCARFGDQLVEAGDQSAILAYNGADAGIPCRIGADDIRTAVARSVVEQEELEIIEVLRQHALDRVGKEGLAIIDAHRDTDCREVHGYPIIRLARAKGAQELRARGNGAG
ncbi:hypothetical protein KSW81_002824 [Nannochloris sp. 'desiccata']|nr:hypothetical protein KSW81_002824 [Chlorella desiccata (nom. nud.)]